MTDRLGRLLRVTLEAAGLKGGAERQQTQEWDAPGSPCRNVTVLFATLKGSMELLADRDPEEARKILDPVLEHMMEAVHRYEGTVNQVMGDGIMALFGAPTSPMRTTRCERAMRRSGCRSL